MSLRWVIERHGSPCPSCGAVLNLHEQVAGPAGAIRDGDVAVCGACRSVLMRDGAAWRVMSRSEVEGLSPELARAVAACVDRPRRVPLS